MPARTASGISATNPESLKSRNININGLITAVSFVEDPVFIAATVLIVAAEPGSEPVRAQTIFPTPCPRSIPFEGVFVLRRESATSTVKRLSEESTIARVTA